MSATDDRETQSGEADLVPGFPAQTGDDDAHEVRAKIKMGDVDKKRAYASKGTVRQVCLR